MVENRLIREKSSYLLQHAHRPVDWYPSQPRQGMMGLSELITHIDEIWKSEEKELLFDQANKLVDLFERSVTTRGDEIPTDGTLQEALYRGSGHLIMKLRILLRQLGKVHG